MLEVEEQLVGPGGRHRRVERQTLGVDVQVGEISLTQRHQVAERPQIRFQCCHWLAITLD